MWRYFDWFRCKKCGENFSREVFNVSDVWWEQLDKTKTDTHTCDENRVGLAEYIGRSRVWEEDES